MKSKYLLNAVFIGGLFVLILNDHVLKTAFGNGLTGKLSDVAGLLIFPLFLKFVFSASDRAVVTATLLGFLYWKSPFSQPFIDLYNSVTLLPVARVVDYTDYFALLVLPLSYYVLKNIERFQWRRRNPS